MPEYYRHKLANGKSVMEIAPDHPVGLPDLPDCLPRLPVLRRQGRVPVLRHQPQLAPAQAGGPPLHRRQVRRRRAGGAGDHRPLRHRRGVSTRLHAHRRRDHLQGRTGRTRPTSTAATPRPSRSASLVAGSARWSRRRCRATTCSGFKDYGAQIYHPNYEVWDRAAVRDASAPARRATSGATSGTGASWTPPRSSGRAYVIPNFVAGVEMAKPFGFTDGRRGHRAHHRGARLLHVAAASRRASPPGARSRRRRWATPTRRARRWSTTSGCWRPTARRSRSYGLRRRRDTAWPEPGNAVFSVSSFMDTLRPEEVPVEEAVPTFTP